VAAVSNVLIVGAGIAGMTLALALKRVGIRSEIIEIDATWTVLGVGISLQGPALRALRAVELLDECVHRGFGYSCFKACNVKGEVMATVDLPRLNGPDRPATIGIMRTAVHAVLKESIVRAQVPVRLGVSVASLEQTERQVSVRFTDGTDGCFDLVVGADGANSKVRTLTFDRICAPEYTGQAVWRATVRRPAEVQARHAFFGPRNKAGFNPVSRAQMYVFLVQNLPTFTRLPDECLANVMREQLVDFGGLVAAVRDEITDQSTIVYRPVHSFMLPRPWYRGRVVLIGDAAHTTTPHMAAGAGIAVEDTIVLAELLQSERSVDAALERFMGRRYQRCKMVVDNSRMLGEWEKNPGASGADPVGVFDRSMKELAQPI